MSPREAIRKALAFRPEVRQSRKNLEIDDYNIRRYTNAQRPDLSLTASYSATGLGGNLHETSLLGGTSRLLEAGGFPAAMNQLFQFAFPTYSVGVTLDLPLRNRRAAVDLANSALSKKRNMYELRSLEQDIRLEVLNAITGVELSKAANPAGRSGTRLLAETPRCGAAEVRPRREHGVHRAWMPKTTWCKASPICSRIDRLQAGDGDAAAGDRRAPRGAGRPRGVPAALELKIGGAWRSLVARLLWEQEVGGSNPSAPTIGRGCPVRVPLCV